MTAHVGLVDRSSKAGQRMVTATAKKRQRFSSAPWPPARGLWRSARGPYAAGGAARQAQVKPARTLDLVVLAGEWGGRRRGTLSNLHLGRAATPSAVLVMLERVKGYRRNASLEDSCAARSRNRARSARRVRAARNGVEIAFMTSGKTAYRAGWRSRSHESNGSEPTGGR